MNGRSLGVGAALIVLIAGGVFVFKKMNPVSQLGRVSGEHQKVKGAADAPVQMVEYSDFQCPACKSAQATIGRLLSQYPTQTQLVFRHFPLPGHQWSMFAHQAAECANKEGKFWPYHDRLFAGQDGWSKSQNPAEVFLTYAKDSGVNLEAFAACLSDEAVKKSILEEKSKGEDLKITATPTFFINGERIVGPMEMASKGENAVRKALGMPEIVVPPPPAPAPAPVTPPAPAIEGEVLSSPPQAAELAVSSPEAPAATSADGSK